jgi:hypothetical protein
MDNPWQSMDTAPKDGTKIIVWLPRSAQQVSSVYWHNGAWLGGPVGNSVEIPAYWLPLVDLPMRAHE